MPAYPNIEAYYEAIQQLIEYGGSDSERSYLRALVGRRSNGPTASEAAQNDEFEDRRQRMNDVIEEINANGGGLRMDDNVPREALYERSALR